MISKLFFDYVGPIWKKIIADPWRDAFSREPWWIELLSAICAMGWSLISVFANDDLSSRPTFSVILSIANYKLWEVLGISIGLAQGFCLFHRAHIWRMACSIIASWWFGFLGMAIYFWDSSAPSIIFYLALCVFNAIIVTIHARRYA